MRRVIFLVSILAGMLITLPVYAQSVTEQIYKYGAVEKILSYEVDIRVDTNSTLTVVENIKVVSMGMAIQRGIFRKLPRNRDINGNVVYVKNKFVSAKRDGKKEPFHTTIEGEFDVMYIGDEDVFLKPGLYEYELTYTTERQIGFFDTFDELYWNVTGNEWAFAIDQVKATIHLPDGTEILQHACYTGYRGSTETNCRVNQLSSHVISWEASGLREAEGLTVAVGFNKGVVKMPELPSYMGTKRFASMALVITCLMVIAMFLLWKRYGIDHESPVVIPRFSPPIGLSPAEAGYVQYGYFKTEMITATLVSLAVKGYISIEEHTKKGFWEKTSYTLHKKTPSRPVPLTDDENYLMNNLFRSYLTSVTLTGRYSSDLASVVTNFIKKVDKKYSKLHAEGRNRWLVWVLFSLVAVFYLAMLLMCHIHLYFPGKTIGGSVLLFIYLFMFGILSSVPSARTARWIWIISAALSALFFFVGYRFFNYGLDPYTTTFLFLIVNCNLLLIFAYLIRRPSLELINKKAEIDGFMMYLKAAEKQVMQFHNPPQMTPEIFEKNLPFAMVLGVEKIWGAKFDNWLERSHTTYRNTWYNGRSHSSFSAGTMSSLSASLSNSISSGSSSSGSSGGGSSGGGGGGGGGGGW